MLKLYLCSDSLIYSENPNYKWKKERVQHRKERDTTKAKSKIRNEDLLKIDLYALLFNTVIGGYYEY